MISTFLTLAQAPAQGQNPFGQFIIIIPMMIMFYFLLIRPQQKQRKELEARIANLQPGVKVITSAGIHALVHNVKEKTVILKIADGTMVEFDKAAIAQIVKEA